ncbi:DUF2382 domain-containing protein [Geminocystis sp.]|uniref:DUF2382 domain-containing protein n=1 Tax=Geminocystis sp. TaxID=2664100 RepID=UPI00359374FB
MNTNTNRNKRAIGTFPTPSAAEQTLRELKDSGFAMDQVSVVAQGSEQNETITSGADVSDHADNKADDGAKVGALSGGALGTLTGLLVGLGALAIPGVGPIILAGAVSTVLATTVAGGAIGAAAGGLVGGLIGLGIPEEQAKIYNDRVSAGEYLVMVDGTDAEIAKAEAILNHHDIEEWGVYDVPETEATTANQEAIATHSVDMLDRVTPVAALPVVNNSEAKQRANATPSDDVQTVKLYEERLVMNKDRQKIGEVKIGKHVELETAHVSVPLEKERIVIVTIPPSGETVDASNVDAFHNSGTVRVEVYEDTPTIHKEAFLREEVTIRKEVIQETVKAEETLRREELDVDTQGSPVIDNHSKLTGNPRR